jgi:hypothetical protein
MAKITSGDKRPSKKKHVSVTMTMKAMIDVDQFSYYEDTDEGPHTGERVVPSSDEEILHALQKFTDNNLEKNPCGILFQIMDDDGSGRYEWDIEVDDPK